MSADQPPKAATETGAATAHENQPAPKRRARRWLWLTLMGTAALGVLAVAARKDIAREGAEAWLGRQGIPAEIRIDRLSLKQVSGHAVLGKPDAPDLVLETFAVDYELGLFRAGQPLARLTQITLTRPRLTFTYDAKGLNLGMLQPLLERTQPDTATAPPDIIDIRDADLTARTAYGTLKGTAQARLLKGRLNRADLIFRPSAFSGPMAQGHLTSGTVSLRSQPDATAGEALHLQAKLAADRLSLTSADPLSGETLTVGLEARLPYRDRTERLFDGPLTAALTFKADRLHSTTLEATQLETRLTTTGTLSDNLHSFSGQTRLSLTAQSLDSPDLRARDLMITGEALPLEAHLPQKDTDTPALHLTGPLRADAAHLTQGSLMLETARIALDDFRLTHADNRTDMAFTGRAEACRLTQNDLSLNRLEARLGGDARLTSDSGLTARIDADLKSPDARYTGLAEAARKRARDLALSREAAREAYDRALLTAPADAPPAPLPPERPDVLVSLSRAVERFTLEARGAHLILDSGGFDLSLSAPAHLTPASGGHITVTPLPRRPLISNQRAGALTLDLSGGDLPETTARIADITLMTGGAVKGRFTAQTSLSFAPLYDADLNMKGLFHYSASGTLIDLSDCIALKAGRADIGGRLTDVTGQICRNGAPLVRLTPSGQWRAEGRFADLRAEAPDYQARLSEGAGRFTARSLSDGLAFTAGLEALQAQDTLEVPRFHPLGLRGEVGQDGKTLTGRLFVSPHSPAVLARAPDPIATIDLRSDVASGAGRADITADHLSFAPQGLQPLDLTPAVAGVATRDVTGSLAFKGFIGWQKDGGTSGGTLTLKGIDFNGPLGQGLGLRGEMTFTSLAPLASDTGQTLRLDRFVTLIPLTDIDTRLQFFADHVVLEQADITTPGGHLQLEPMPLPFDVTEGFSGAIRFSQLDFGQVIAATDFGRDMKFEGTVSGRLPFALTGGTFRFDKGELKGDGPGRVSISRAALQGTPEGSATATPETGNLPVQTVEGTAIENMAYQALENLSYKNLEASIATLDNGRLGFNFRINGTYDPPEKKEARIGILDYLRGAWASKPMDLPSGTGVDLHLGMTLNLDQVMQDLADFDRLKRGQAPAPAPPQN